MARYLDELIYSLGLLSLFFQSDFSRRSIFLHICNFTCFIFMRFHELTVQGALWQSRLYYVYDLCMSNL